MEKIHSQGSRPISQVDQRNKGSLPDREKVINYGYLIKKSCHGQESQVSSEPWPSHVLTSLHCVCPGPSPSRTSGDLQMKKLRQVVTELPAVQPGLGLCHLQHTPGSL